MIRLCNDHNLTIPDNVLVYLFSKFEQKFGSSYQNKITKTNYRDDESVRNLVNEIIEHFNSKILQDLETERYVKFKYKRVGKSDRITIKEMEN